jgi:hypothetical protein
MALLVVQIVEDDVYEHHFNLLLASVALLGFAHIGLVPWMLVFFTVQQRSTNPGIKNNQLFTMHYFSQA